MYQKELEAGLARVHCDFKFRFVRTLFFHARNQFELVLERENDAPQGTGALKASPDTNSNETNHRKNVSTPQPRAPYSLNPRYVGREAMKKTRELIETKARP